MVDESIGKINQQGATEAEPMAYTTGQPMMTYGSAPMVYTAPPVYVTAPVGTTEMAPATYAAAPTYAAAQQAPVTAIVTAPPVYVEARFANGGPHTPMAWRQQQNWQARPAQNNNSWQQNSKWGQQSSNVTPANIPQTVPVPTKESFAGILDDRSIEWTAGSHWILFPFPGGR
eukprot:Skav227289  [mRNA]  locus=scaffold4822:38561:49097:+ [translate_table: standard]